MPGDTNGSESSVLPEGTELNSQELPTINPQQADLLQRASVLEFHNMPVDNPYPTLEGNTGELQENTVERLGFDERLELLNEALAPTIEYNEIYRFYVTSIFVQDFKQKFPNISTNEELMIAKQQYFTENVYERSLSCFPKEEWGKYGPYFHTSLPSLKQSLRFNKEGKLLYTVKVDAHDQYQHNNMKSTKTCENLGVAFPQEILNSIDRSNFGKPSESHVEDILPPKGDDSYSSSIDIKKFLTTPMDFSDVKTDIPGVTLDFTLKGVTYIAERRFASAAFEPDSVYISIELD